MKGEKINNVEEDSLNVTYDSIDMGNKDLTAKYRGEFDKATPKFKGMPRDYYPTTAGSMAFGCLMCLPVYIVCGLILWGFIEWGLASPVSLGWTNFGVFMGYLAFIVIMVYFGSAERKKIEREFINNKIKLQEKEKEEKKIKDKEYQDFLNQYKKKKKLESRVYQ